MGRYALIIVTGLGLVYGTTRLNMNHVASASANVTNQKYKFTSAKNLAHSTAMLCCEQLAQSPGWRTGYPPPGVQMYGGVATASVSTAGSDSVLISSTATVQDTTASVQLLVKTGTELYFPCQIHALVTSQNNVGANGCLTLDGRDHSPTAPYAFLPNSHAGVLGISTTKPTVSISGNCDVGGTSSGGTDYAPSNPYNPNVVQTSATWPDGYPSSPDSVMGGAVHGYSEGTLKSVALNGYNGSQYVTNPNQLHYPLHGVTYVELPSGQTWDPVNFGSGGQGIMVVHNQQHNAVMKNLNGGTFTGVLIADDVVHTHTTIVGVIFTLTPNPSEGNVIGNGEGSVLYSRQAVQNAMHQSGFDPLLTILNYWE